MKYTALRKTVKLFPFLCLLLLLSCGETGSGDSTETGDGDGSGDSGSATVATWRLETSCSESVQLKFYNDARTKVWPSSTTHYSLGRSERTFRLSCAPGERICYGAEHSDGGTWGVGASGDESCSSCCLTCGSSGGRDLTCS